MTRLKNSSTLSVFGVVGSTTWGQNAEASLGLQKPSIDPPRTFPTISAKKSVNWSRRSTLQCRPLILHCGASKIVLLDKIGIICTLNQKKIHECVILAPRQKV